MEHLLNSLDPAQAALFIESSKIEVSDDTGPSEAGPRAPEFDIGGLAASFSAVGGLDLSGEACAALALEIVFSQIVERARQITDATSACIVFKKGAEVIRCASNDQEVRDLPHWLDIGTGLAAECLTRGQVQRCDDAQTDQRSAAQVYYPLGIQSLLLLPLSHKAEVVGVLGVCASRSAAFTDAAVPALQALCERALESVRSAEASCVPGLSETPQAAHVQLPTSLETSPVDAPVPDDAGKHKRKFNGRYGLIFGFSGAAVVGTVAVSILVGLHLGRQRAMKDFERTARSTAPVAIPAPIEPDAQIALSPPKTNRTPVADIPVGSLVIYENGKEVLRQLPPARANRQGSSGTVTPASAIDSLPIENRSSGFLYRVEPEYPPQALRDGIQGSVVLDLYIDKDGSVQLARVVSGPTLLADAAAAAVKQWRFQPHFVDGRQVSMQTRVTVRFSLPNHP
jgi:TonB family protein